MGSKHDADLSGFKLPEGKQLWFALGALGVLALLLKSSTTEYSSAGAGFVNPITGKKLATTGKLAFMFERSGDHLHRGVDIPAPKGTPVRAAANGIVRVATEVYKQGFSGYGAVVVLEHDGVWTLYGHLDSVRVSPGQKVGAGQQIGTVGTTQFFSDDPTRMDKIGAHLHFEVSPTRYPQASEANRIDPVAWLRSGGATVA
jgi:murein DD-endopeptidase MepM/ murein hydrolase activator NlpD